MKQTHVLQHAMEYSIMTIRKVVKRMFPEVKGLEATLITMSIRDKTWGDFKHNKKQRFILTLLSYILPLW